MIDLRTLAAFAATAGILSEALAEADAADDQNDIINTSRMLLQLYRFSHILMLGPKIHEVKDLSKESRDIALATANICEILLQTALAPEDEKEVRIVLKHARDFLGIGWGTSASGG